MALVLPGKRVLLFCYHVYVCAVAALRRGLLELGEEIHAMLRACTQWDISKDQHSHKSDQYSLEQRKALPTSMPDLEFPTSSCFHHRCVYKEAKTFFFFFSNEESVCFNIK